MKIIPSSSEPYRDQVENEKPSKETKPQLFNIRKILIILIFVLLITIIILLIAIIILLI